MSKRRGETFVTQRDRLKRQKSFLAAAREWADAEIELKKVNDGYHSAAAWIIAISHANNAKLSAIRHREEEKRRVKNSKKAKAAH